MALNKIDVLAVGRGSLVDNTNAVVTFSSNNLVADYGPAISYSQYNVVEYGGHAWRSKVNANINNQPDISPNHWELLYKNVKDGDIAFVINGILSTVVQRTASTWTTLASQTSPIVDADLYDPIATTLPTGTGATIDGVAVVNDMRVLFSNLTVGNNRLYKVSGVGVSLVWTAVAVWPGGLTPSLGDNIIINQGTTFGLRQGLFDGSAFKFNDTVRYFTGTDYWELSSLKTLNFLNNATGNVFTVNATGSENMVIDFSIVRGAAKLTATIHLTSDGTNASVSTSGAALSSVGVLFDAYISAGDLYLDLIADNAGMGGVMKYFVKRWSDSPGGPGGIPNYSTGPVVPSNAAGSTGDVQFNNAGALAADSEFKWDATDKALQLNDLSIGALKGPVTLVDNTTNGTIFLYPATFKHAVMECSIERNGAYRTSRYLIVHNGTTVVIQGDSVETADPLVTHDAIISGPDVVVRYTAASTGFNGSFKYSIRKWDET